MAYEDLLKDNSVSIENGNFFNVTITDLDINTSYPLQFRWNYSDGTQGPWSAVRIITTPGEETPETPSTLTVTGGAGIITVTWDGKDATGNLMTNIDRIDLYIDGTPFDGTKPADFMLSAGTKTISAPSGDYTVAAYAVSKANTKSAISDPVPVSVTAAVPPVQGSVTPSTPTVSSVLGAIQLSWNGKTSTGANQPYGFDAAKVYIGTTSDFTPSASNQVDTLNFANGQNTLNIGVGTVVNGTALNYGINYYVKIATTNGTDTSTAVSATGNPVQIGKVTSGDIVTITADKIETGTVSSQVITVGNPEGKHVTLAGTGDPFTIYDTDGTTKLLSYSTTSGKLSITGDGSFTGELSIGTTNDIFRAKPDTGIWLGNAAYADAPFSVSKNGVIKANSGKIGGWTLANSYLQNTAGTFQINSNASTIYVGPYATGDHIRISASGGIQHTNSDGDPTGNFTLTPNGNLTLSGEVTITSGDTYDDIQTAKTDAAAASSAASTANTTADSANAAAIAAASIAGTALQADGTYVTKNSSNQITKISTEGGIIITSKASGEGSRVELTNTGFYAYNGATPMVQIDAVNGNAKFVGTIEATGGYFGGSSSYWQIDSSGIISNGSARIKVGNYSITSINGTDFAINQIYEDNSYSTIIQTNTVTGATDPNRIFIGDSTRQVEVAKSAQIEGDGAGANQQLTSGSSSSTINAYRSGGLRNIFTNSIDNQHGSDSTQILDYPSSIKGDLLVYYDASVPTNGGQWKKVTAIYLNTSGSSGTLYYYARYKENPSTSTCTYEPVFIESTTILPNGITADELFTVESNSTSYIRGYYSTISAEDAIAQLNADPTATYCGVSSAPVIATTSTLTPGDSGASIVVTSTGFATTVSSSNFTIVAGTSGLTLSSITNTSTTSKTLVFTGTVGTGNLQITAKASAYSPTASADSNTLTITPGVSYYYAYADCYGPGGTYDTDPTCATVTTLPSGKSINTIYTTSNTPRTGTTRYEYWGTTDCSTSLTAVTSAATACSGTTPTPSTPTPTTPTPTPAVPVNSTAPVVSPSSGIEGTTEFSATSGEWTNTPTSYTYQWKYDDSFAGSGPWLSLPNATSSTYTTPADYVATFGTRLICYVTAINGDGSSTAKESNTVTISVPPAPVNTIAPHLTNSGTLITSTSGTWSNSPTSYVYRWYRDDVGPTSAGNPLRTSSTTTNTTDTYTGSTSNNYGIYTIVTATNDAGHDVANSDNTIELYVAPTPTPTTPTPTPTTPTPSTPTPTTPTPTAPPACCEPGGSCANGASCNGRCVCAG